MASDTNKVIVIGRLTRDPEARTLASGTTLADLSIAVNSTQKKGDDWEDHANFFNVTVFGRGAESTVKFCKKGHRVAVTGRLEQRRWETDDGAKRDRVSIVADSVQFLKEKSADGAASEPTSAAPTSESPF